MTDDPCCWACETKTGDCRTSHKCHHHKRAQRRLNADDRARKLYPNPTQDQALRNIARDEQAKKRQKASGR